MKAKEQIQAAVILSYANMLLGLLISFLYTPFMLRILGKSEYGLYNIAASFVGYLGLLDFGFSSAYIRFFSQYHVKKDTEGLAKLNGTFTLLFTIIGLFVLITGGILILNLDVFFGKKLTIDELQKTKHLVAILVVNLALSFPFQIFSSYMNAREKFVYQRLLQLLKTMVNPLLAILLMLAGYQSFALVAAIVTVNMSINIVNMVYAIYKLHITISFRKMETRFAKEIAGFSGFIFINMVVDEINWNVDKMLLGSFSGTTAVAVYSLAGQINSYYKSISTSVSNVFSPKIHRMVLEEDDAALTNIFTRVGRIQFMLLSAVLLGVCFWGKYFILLWGGKGYEDAFPILLILMFAVTIPLMQNLGIEIQRAKNMHQFRSFAYLLIALLNIFLSIPLCKRFEGIGCSIGTAVSLVIGNGWIMNWYYSKKMKLDIRYFWSQILKILPALIFPLVYGMVVTTIFPVNSVVTFIIELVLFLGLFVWSLHSLGMNEEEKQLFYNLINKVRNLKK